MPNNSLIITGPGIYPVFKPVGPSSHTIVNQVRRLTGIKRVGHGGTLDPLASGVLVIAVGREYTKLLESYVKQEKEYLATFKFGETSSTDDEEGIKSIVEIRHGVSLPTRSDIEMILPQFTGLINQIPPAFSAVKVGGVPAYKRARRLQGQSQPVELPPSREREVKSIQIMDYQWPLLQLRIVTGKGVYIRSLARDIGNALNVGGYMTALVRARVGQFTINDCIHLD